MTTSSLLHTFVTSAAVALFAAGCAAETQMPAPAPEPAQLANHAAPQGDPCSAAFDGVEAAELGSAVRATVWLYGAVPVDLDGTRCAPAADESSASPTLTSCEAWYACGACKLHVGRTATLQPYRGGAWFVESVSEDASCPAYGLRASFDAH